MRIDVVLEPNLSADQFEELGLLAEQCGLGAVWTANHISARDPFVAFSQLARSSSKIYMGPVALSPYELHPLKMANSLYALNELSGGRAAIVVGGGGGTMLSMGLKAERMVRGTRECIEILKATSCDDVLDYEGEIFKVHNYRPKWATDTKPLIYAASSREQMLRMAARAADGVMMTDITLQLADEAVGYIRSGLNDSGRSAEGFRINNLFAWHVKPDKQEAVREARRKLLVRAGLQPFYVSPFLSDEDCAFVQDNIGAFMTAYFSDSPTIEGVPDRIVDELVEHITLTGDLSELDKQIDKLKTYKAAGFTEFGLRIYDDPAETIKLLGERVVPELAE